MIRHIVTWKLKEQAEGRDRAANLAVMKSALESLPSKIPEIRRFEVGINSLHPETNDHIVLTADFDTPAALKTYAEHPEHLKVADLVAKLRSSRACIDYEV